MPTARSLLPYKDTPEADLSRVQGFVPNTTKRRILSIIGDDGAYTLIIQHAFQNAERFILDNQLSPFDDTSFNRLVDFIRNGTAPRPAGPTDEQHVAGRAASVQPTDAATASKPGRNGKGDTRRSRVRAQEE